jgi:hypothetical protein
MVAVGQTFACAREQRGLSESFDVLYIILQASDSIELLRRV